MNQDPIEKTLGPEIENFYKLLEPNSNESGQFAQISQNIGEIGKLLDEIVNNSSHIKVDSLPEEKDNPSKSEANEIKLSDSNSKLNLILEELKGIVPESFSQGKSEKVNQNSLEILNFSLRTDVDKYEDTLKKKELEHLREPQEKPASIKEVYNIILGYNGSEAKENIDIFFCNTESVIPIFTIKHLIPYTKPEINVSIPFDLFFNSQYAKLLVAEGEKDLATLKIFPIEIKECMPIDGNLQLKIINNLGKMLDCIIYEENTDTRYEIKLKAGDSSLHTINLASGRFSVYSANYKRSNIKKVD